MRLVKLWVPTFVGMLSLLNQVSALPVPKLPPEATDKPSIVVRVRPVGELIKDISYIAKMVEQEEVFEAVKPGIEPIIDSLDATKPIGFYAKVGPNGVDSYGILLLPIKNQKDFLTTLKLLPNINPVEGAGGLYDLNVPGAPFGVIFRFANGYVYATVKNTPEAEAGLAANKLFAPQALFKQDDDSVVSITLNADAIPNDLKKKGLAGLEDGLRLLQTQKIANEPNAMIRGLLETAAEELAIKVQSLIVDTLTVTFRVDLDRKKEDLAFGFRLTARGGSDLAAEINSLGAGKSLGAAIASPNAAMNGFANIAVPASLKKALAPVIDDLIGQGWKKAKPEEQPYAKELLEILGPTLKAGILDIGGDVRGPNDKNLYTALFAVSVKDADRLEGLARKIYAMLPEREKADVKLDVAKADGFSLHEIKPKGGDPKNDELFGKDARVIVAFRKDAILFAVGPASDAITAVKSAINLAPKAGAVMEGMTSVRRIAPIIEREDPGAIEAAKKAYPAGVDDTFRLTVAGGQSLDVRFGLSSRIFQFGMLMERAKRNR